MVFKGKTILVTGAGGFIGSHLTEELVVSGARTRALIHYNSLGRAGWLDSSDVRNDVEIFFADITDRDSLKEAVKGVDIVFHLAALIAIPYSYKASLSYLRTNVEGTLNVLQMSLDMDVGLFVHTSTSEVYGTAEYVPIDESHPLKGQSPYSASKIGADKIAEAYHRSFDLPVVTIRPFNTYGPRQSDRAVIPTIITQCLTKEKISLGKLFPTRDFNYVSDIVKGFIKAGTTSSAIGNTINLGTGSEISIGDLAKTIIKLSNRSVEIDIEDQRIRPEKSEVERLLADYGRARDILNWEPEVSLEEGLKKTILWLGENLKVYRPDRYNI